MVEITPIYNLSRLNCIYCYLYKCLENIIIYNRIIVQFQKQILYYSFFYVLENM